MTPRTAEIIGICRLYAKAGIGDDKFKLALISKFATANPTDLFDFACLMMGSPQAAGMPPPPSAPPA